MACCPEPKSPTDGGRVDGGPPPCPGEYCKGIKIDGDDNFRKQTTACLDQIKATPSGAAMLSNLCNGSNTVNIKQTSGGNGADPDDSSKAQRKADGSPGDGTGSTVHFNPTKTQIGDGSQPWMNRPPCVGLGHELVHAYHSANGTNDFSSKGEDMAVGLPPYDKEPISENTMRSEWNPKQPTRTSY